MPEMLQQLGTALFADDSKPAWLLFDAMHKDVRDCLPEDVPDEDIHVISLGRSDIPDECSPAIVAIGPHGVERIRASLAFAMKEQSDADSEKESGFAVGGWLVSDAAPLKLVQHLSSCMKPRLDGVGRKYFRWADRRLMEWMWPALQSHERSALLGPICAWWTLDRCLHLVEHRDAEGDPPLLPWQLTELTWQHAQDCEPVQILLRGWQQFEPELPHDYLARAGHAIRAARSLDLVELADIVLIGTYVLQLHPNLCSHPLMRERVHKAREHKRPLAELLADIPDPDGWDRMRDELTHATVPAA